MNVHLLEGRASARTGDHSVAKAWLRALEATAPIAAHPDRTLPTVIEALAETHGDAPALLSERESFSYRQLVARSNRYARWALQQGIAKGEAVCLMMPNRPEYVAIWLGVTRVGGIVSLINTNLRGPALAHCIDIVEPGHIIVDDELADGFESARAHLKCRAAVWLHGQGSKLPRIDHEIEQLSGLALAGNELRPVSVADRALHIYTSGTTGLPKAANISHHRVMTWSYWFAGMMDAGPQDRMYDCLPLYHSVGGIVAVGAMLARGGSVVIRDRFSASRFWDDVSDWNCTLFQYIGELCRYLVNAGRTRASAATGSGSPAETVCGPMCGTRSRTGSAFRKSSNSTPRRKPISRSTTSRASPAPSAASRRSWRAVSHRADQGRHRDRRAGPRCRRSVRALPRQ